ncbi:hypothetical protein HMN09_00486600 [Mycena chlorophos]|uniref:Uncharacterized protein n=1 Tax=Mycena chlorophos TaxID=658473 RepID=A0A8H6TAJ5_MYCCL|nr:hypothetical protein HMN09_00486600 [Mycena chlorophos]
MASLLQRYTNATPDTRRTRPRRRCKRNPVHLRSSRAAFIQALLTDLETLDGRILPKDAAAALFALKTLGKNPTGSESLGTAPTLSALLRIVARLKDDTEAAGEALRCIANALLLFDQARSIFVRKDVNGGEACIDLLQARRSSLPTRSSFCFQKSTIPDQIFILSRILFLSTVHPSSFITVLVEDKHVVDIVSIKLDLLVSSLLVGTKMSKEAMVDVLKFTFNILMHYPKSLDGGPEGKIIGDSWSPKLDGVYHARLKDSVGEMLFAMCDSDASTMSTLLGYGNVAGFLFNKGIMSAPPPPTSSTGATSTAAALAAASGSNINPITGTTNAPREPEARDDAGGEGARDGEALRALLTGWNARVPTEGAKSDTQGDGEGCNGPPPRLPTTTTIVRMGDLMICAMLGMA